MPPLQQKEALMDENLPEEYRIELAKAFVNDLFSKVRRGRSRFWHQLHANMCKK